jgi:hypothetical protein
MNKKTSIILILVIDLFLFKNLFASTEDKLIYNHFTIKAGVIHPTPLYGNTGLESEKST